ncbi:tol-pal system-associated acyl-CoA thioesterase [Maricaulaceae bacterium NA33B04]|nr:tol-pal system-associated acyl-CoA thioesterase [Maricaulaceae bacterium NA33B04]
MTEPSSGTWTDGIHTLPVRVYYEDTDFTGVVYYANYLKFIERGRTDALRAAGVAHSDLLEASPPLGFAVRKVMAEYFIPARIDNALVVETRVTEARGARIAFSQRILRADKVLFTAEVEAACIDMDGRPRRLPKDVVAALNSATRAG